jgi:hypothetical protein
MARIIRIFLTDFLLLRIRKSRVFVWDLLTDTSSARLIHCLSSQQSTIELFRWHKPDLEAFW